jgi:hypothetical protein
LINPVVTITAQPAAQPVCSGSTATFSVTATGGSLTYQWLKDNVNLVNGGGITGATTATLSLSAVDATRIGNYTCKITNSCGTLTTSPAPLTINVPAITSQPAATNVCSGSNASLTVAATGTGLTYQWKKGSTVLANSSRIAGATSPALAITAVTSTDAGSYTCVITSGCGSVTSTAASIVVTNPIVITTQPVSRVACQQGFATFQVSATGNGLTYRWQRNGQNLPEGSTFVGTTTSSLAVTYTLAGLSDGAFDIHYFVSVL